jgi:subtilase family serine protease
VWGTQYEFFVYGAGGGASFVYGQPSWQKGVVPDSMANVPGAPARVVPDVAMLADPTTGFLIGMSGGIGTYAESPIGGTSLSCPLFSATMALAQQNAGKKFGFANALLYKKRASAFRDIVPLSTPEAAVVPTPYYGDALVTFEYPGISIHTAGGYDNVTGIGVPDGSAFLKAIK